MIRSMTGFGDAEIMDEIKTIQIEIRTVNNRFLKIDSRVPQPLEIYEGQIEGLIKHKISRGSVFIAVNYKPIRQEYDYHLNIDALKRHYHFLQEARSELGIKEDISISSLIQLPGVYQQMQGENGHVEGLWPQLEKMVEAAIEKVVQMRTEEGKNLWKEIETRRNEIALLLKKVEDRAPHIVTGYKQRLHDRISNLLAGTGANVTETDLCREIAMFAERSDITEEIARLKSHLSQLDDTMMEEQPAGKKLEFIVQEMFREANTMASKANDSELVWDIIRIKTEIEKIKEQALNIE
ncbi:MAG TPA: YicC/YloC family endoribonuclease [Candidatus Brocadiia bacterium]|nr:YicC family protein [Planctomycetota bacterium]MBI4007506.1 YicC family protein [Planctomycetota bacterium]MDO8092709.1 YicC/YloC family endoribonuclease [Candidatus Brocadiales bacterium]